MEPLTHRGFDPRSATGIRLQPRLRPWVPHLHTIGKNLWVARLPFILVVCDPAATGLRDARAQQSIQRWLDRGQGWEAPR